MPRFFDSDASPGRLSFTENVTCWQCGEIFEGLFYDYTESLTFEDMTEPPVGKHECPWCSHHFTTEMTGWMFYSEAG